MIPQQYKVKWSRARTSVMKFHTLFLIARFTRSQKLSLDEKKSLWNEVNLLESTLTTAEASKYSWYCLKQMSQERKKNEI